MKNPIADLWRALLVAGLIAATASTQAATLTVTNTDDDGDGSLRAALAAATSGDTIDATGVSGTITLTTGELLVNKYVTLVGPGPGSLAVNGNASSRVFHVTSNITVVIAGLTITNGAVSGSFPGNVGGGVWNQRAALTLSNCVISGNNGGNGPGGGIYNDGLSGLATLSVIASTISGNRATNHGGGIHNAGNQGNAFVSITASTVSSNTAIGAGTVGGGVFNSGNNFGVAGLAVVASTFSGNSANQSGGAIYNTGAGSGNGSLSINTSTFLGNSAVNGGGIFHNGVGGTATLVISGTILKTGASGANIINNGGSVGTFGYNLSSDNGGGVLTNSTDRLNTDPLLGLLADNGGPTLTHALLPGSPAIDKGKSFGATTDQRGQPRPFDFASIPNAAGGDGCDIGAFELNPQARFISITSLADKKIQLQGAGLSNLTYSIQANTNPAVTNWAVIGNATANGSGVFSFTDTNAPFFPIRFYRALFP